ncbi:MAG: LysE family translocator [Chromatiales bacterium]|nr:LysE family translocator [Chromatiales bacterium]
MSVIIAMGLFSLSMSISPGPVNLIALTSGVNSGFRRAMPFVSGATIGFTLLLSVVGLGVGVFVAESPLFLGLLGYLGTGFICYMGYKIATSTPEIKVASQRVPSFSQGFLLQWLNPKAWIACLSGVSAFNLAGSYLMLAVFIGLYFVICYASIASWALVGDKIQRFLLNERYLRVFNTSMGGMLMLVALYLLGLQFYTV